MDKPKRELLRPEDATSLEEFQARKQMEQLSLRGLSGSGRNLGLTLLSVVPGFAAVILWAVVGVAASADQWGGMAFALVFALVATGLFIWIFGKVMRPALRGTRRYTELDRLARQWEELAAHGEIPQTTDGGPKVWRDELEPSDQP